MCAGFRAWLFYVAEFPPAHQEFSGFDLSVSFGRKIFIVFADHSLVATTAPGEPQGRRAFP
jgi:hypothetical protein